MMYNDEMRWFSIFIKRFSEVDKWNDIFYIINCY